MASTETVAGWATLLAVSSVTAAVIVNGALGNYEDNKGHAYGAASNQASTSVAGVSAAMVLPKETAVDPVTEAATHGTVATKTFTIDNDSNITDAYVISAITVNAGSVRSVTFKPAGAAAVAATVGATQSPAVAPGGSIGVVVTVSTAGAAVGSSIEVSLTAKTTAKSQNGSQSDTGKAWIYVARGPVIAGIPPVANSNAQVPVADFVNGGSEAAAQPGAALTFRLPFTNIGDAPAYGVTVTDTLPSALRVTPGALGLECVDRRSGKTVSSVGDARIGVNGNTVTATIPQLDPGVEVVLTDGVTASGSVPLGTTLSDAPAIAAASLATIQAEPAVVFFGAMNTVFDAVAGSAHPIAGATVAIVDPTGGHAVNLAAPGTAPNTGNANPFSTTNAGTFGFALPATRGHQSDYDLYVTAGGYLNRRIKVAVADGPGGLPTTTLTALDNLPLATPGGFGLTANPVTVNAVANFFGNVPLFAPQALTLTIAVDRSVASAGDRLAYTVNFGPGSKPLAFASTLTVALPPGFAYARNTGRLAAQPVEPAIAGRDLTWPLKELTAAQTLTYDAVVVPGVSAGATLSTHAHLAVQLPGAPLTVDAAVNVAVVGGALSSRSILSGRVFTDRGHDGRFAAGDTGVAGVRIFLEDGESVITDRDGRFSFPAARPGMHVLHLDPVTLPAGLHAYHGFPVNDPRSALRLVHGIMDSGLMDDVNFAVSDAAGS